MAIQRSECGCAGRVSDGHATPHVGDGPAGDGPAEEGAKVDLGARMQGGPSHSSMAVPWKCEAGLAHSTADLLALM